MKILSAIIGGFAGACALNLVHQSLKKVDKDAPHVDELGMEALAKGLTKVGITPPQGVRLFNATLASDVISNSLYYSLAAIGSKKGVSMRATALGVLAGIGAVYLPKTMHLNQQHTARTPRTKALTILLYTFGGIMAGSTIQSLNKKTS